MLTAAVHSAPPAPPALPALHTALIGALFQLTIIVGIGPQNLVLLRQGVLRLSVGLVVSVFILGDAILLSLGTAGVSVVVERMPLILEILRWGGVVYLLWFAVRCLRDVRDPVPIGSLRESTETSGSPGEDAQETEGVEEAGGIDGVQASSHSQNTPRGPNAPGHGQVVTLPKSTLRTRIRRSPSLTATGHRTLPAALPLALAVTFLNPAAYVDGLIVFGSMSNQYQDAGKWVFTAGAIVGSSLFFLAIGYGARLLSAPLSRTSVWRWINLSTGLLMIAMAARLAFGV